MTKIKNLLFHQMKFFVSSPALLWQIIFLGIPIIFILFSSILNKNLVLDSNYIFSVFDYTHLRIVLRTIIISLINTLLCLVIGYPVAYFIAFKTNRFRNVWLTFLMLPLWVNFLVQVYAWFFVLEKHGVVNDLLMFFGIIKEPLHLTNNLLAVLLVMLHVYLPFMIMPLYNILEKFDLQLIEASLDLGASKWQTFRKITFPLSLAGVYLGFFLVFVMSYGEVAIPLLLGGNKNLFVGSLISQYFLSIKDNAKGSAFTLFSSIVLAITLLIFYFFIKRRSKEI